VAEDSVISRRTCSFELSQGLQEAVHVPLQLSERLFNRRFTASCSTFPYGETKSYGENRKGKRAGRRPPGPWARCHVNTNRRNRSLPPGCVGSNGGLDGPTAADCRKRRRF
jgi:hypothetical protein